MKITDKDVRDAIELDIYAAEKAFRSHLINVRRLRLRDEDFAKDLDNCATDTFLSRVTRFKAELSAFDAAHPQQSESADLDYEWEMAQAEFHRAQVAFKHFQDLWKVKNVEPSAEPGTLHDNLETTQGEKQ